MIESVNLSLSSACGANCIFCPANRGTRIKQKIMPFETAKKVIDEVSSPEFRKKYNMQRMEVGENGDAFINPDWAKVLRYIREKLPDIRIILHSNFQLFTRDKAEIIFGENLVDRFTCNIDGSTKENYHNVKRLDYENTMKNLKDFAETRKKYDRKSPLKVLVLTLNNYINTIHKNFGVFPQKVTDKCLKDVPDDFDAIKKQLEEILDVKSGDCIVKSWVYGWAEREQIDVSKINYKKYACPMLIRLDRDVFIAPDGTWYACCLDANNELVVGNVNENTIDELYTGECRKNMMSAIKKQEFERVGGPCKTVNCCQLVHKNRLLTLAARILYKRPRLLKLAILTNKDARDISALNIKS
ncbi:MAG: radical SAM/SPASM domain-containing protein [archaeon]